MISTLQGLGESLPVLGLSRWMRTDLILAATLLFLVFASWAMLVAAQPSRPRSAAGSPPNPELQTANCDEPSSDKTRRNTRRGLGMFSIVLGLLCSLVLFLVCAW
jgi:hypothetical protein